MSKTKLEAARELIKERQYAEARIILRTMSSDPTAKRWLAKLDEIAPERQRSSDLPLIIIAVVIIIIGVAVVLIALQNRSQPPAASVAVAPTLAALPTDVPTATLTHTPTPSETPTPTETSIPTDTPTATFTPTQLPTDTPPPTSTPTVASTSTPRPTRVLTSTPSISTYARSWLFTNETNAFDDTTTLTLLREADAPIRGWLDNFTPVLVLRCQARHFDVFVHTGTQFEVEYGRLDESTVRLRFDRDPAYDLILGQSTSGEAVFFNQPIEMTQELVSHNTLLFGFTPFNASFASATFDLRGLSEVIGPLVEECSLPPLDRTSAPVTAAACPRADYADGVNWALQVTSLISEMAQQQAVQPSSEGVSDTRAAIEALPAPDCVSPALQYVWNMFDEMYLASISASAASIELHSNNAISQFQLFIDEVERLLPGMDLS